MGSNRKSQDGSIKRVVKTAEPILAEVPSESKIKSVTVISLFPARLEYIGAISGQAYTWAKAGDTVSVDLRDVPDLLSKRIGERACCGASGNGNKLFEVI